MRRSHSKHNERHREFAWMGRRLETAVLPKFSKLVITISHPKAHALAEQHFNGFEEVVDCLDRKFKISKQNVGQTFVNLPI